MPPIREPTERDKRKEPRVFQPAALDLRLPREGVHTAGRIDSAGEGAADVVAPSVSIRMP